MLTLEDILTATSGQLLQKGRTRTLGNFSINSRTIKSGQVFIAIEGERCDGHDFITKAVEAGACGVVVSRQVPVPSHVFVVKVKDTTVALNAIAGSVRQKFKIPFIVITGSAGKTTTKELIAAVLGRKYRVLKNEKNENNHIGVPLTIFKLRPSHQVAVLEIGTNQPGDIARLAKIIQPDVAVFTNIGDSHLEKLKSRKGVFHEKSRVLDFLAAGATVIFNADDPFLRRLTPAKEDFFRFVSFGVEHAADYQASDLRLTRGRWQFRCRGKIIAAAGFARHTVYNALAAICCARRFGIPFKDIQPVLSRKIRLPGRLNWQKFGAMTVIDDTYNANPQSFQCAIEALQNYPASRRVMVISDMLELGSQAKMCHQALGRTLALARLDVVFGCGPLTRHTMETLQASGTRVSAIYGVDQPELHRYLREMVGGGDVILVKGSHGMKMDQTVNFLKTLQPKF